MLNLPIHVYITIIQTIFIVIITENVTWEIVFFFFFITHILYMIYKHKPFFSCNTPHYKITLITIKISIKIIYVYLTATNEGSRRPNKPASVTYTKQY